MSRRRPPRGRERIRGATKRVYEPQGGRLSGIAVAFAIALGGVIFSLAPISLKLAPVSYSADALLSLAISCWFWGFVGLIREINQIKSLVGINREGWRSLAITVFFATPVVGIYQRRAKGSHLSCLFMDGAATTHILRPSSSISAVSTASWP